MTLFQIVVLGFVQGITEFLPISSSGHLVIVDALLGKDGIPESELLTVEVILHAGTLLTILAFYRRRIVFILRGEIGTMVRLIVGSIPVVLIGLPAKMFFEKWLASPMLAGLMLPVTGLLLLWVRDRPEGETQYARLSYPRAFAIGCFQAFAILPGISRSGSTIVGGLLMGLSRPVAAEFSFLLAVPAIGGATLLEVVSLWKDGEGGVSAGMLFLGAIVSFLVGLGALKWLLAWLVRGRLHWFAYWCLLVGGAVIVWQFLELRHVGGQ